MPADAAASYRRALWHDQDTEPVVFTEKDAISGVLYPVTSDWDVPLGVLRCPSGAAGGPGDLPRLLGLPSLAVR